MYIDWMKCACEKPDAEYLEDSKAGDIKYRISGGQDVESILVLYTLVL